jgi:hypothetical protein
MSSCTRPKLPAAVYLENIVNDINEKYVFGLGEAYN